MFHIRNKVTLKQYEDEKMLTDVSFLGGLSLKELMKLMSKITAENIINYTKLSSVNSPKK